MERVRPKDYLDLGEHRQAHARELLQQVGKIERNKWRGRLVTQAFTLLLLADIEYLQSDWRNQRFSSEAEEERAQGRINYAEELLERIEEMVKVGGAYG